MSITTKLPHPGGRNTANKTRKTDRLGARSAMSECAAPVEITKSAERTVSPGKGLGEALSAFTGAMPRMVRAAAAVTAMLAALAMPTTALAQAARHAAIVADANNGAVLHADQADELRYPASLTKIMTLYLAFEAIEQGRASYTTRIKVSQEAASQPPTKLDLDPGETIALIDAIKALITKSANDAAVAIAEHFGGTESRFARMMTDKARLLGLPRTTFRNASGLPDPEQVTTARDMLTLALRIQDDFPKHYHLFATRSFTYDGSSYRNHNNLLHRFQGTDGIKTGYTRASGFNLVTSVRRGGRHVVGVVLGGRSAARRDDAMQLLVSRALQQSSPYKTRKPAPALVAIAKPAPRPQPAPAASPAPSPAPDVRMAGARGGEAPSTEVRHPRPVMVPQRPRPAFAQAGMTTLPPTPPAPTPPAARPEPIVPPAPVAAVRPVRTAAPPPAAESGPRLAFAPRAWNDQPPMPTAAASGTAIGMPPSSLQQQAQALARANEQPSALPRAAPRPHDPPYVVRGPVPPPTTPDSIGGSFEIQIGAYGTAPEAERALAAARSSAGNLLLAHEARSVAVTKETRRIFRARFVGFDSRTAASTCLELRRRQIDCFVMRTE